MCAELVVCALCVSDLVLLRLTVSMRSSIYVSRSVTQACRDNCVTTLNANKSQSRIHLHISAQLIVFSPGKLLGNMILITGSSLCYR